MKIKRDKPYKVDFIPPVLLDIEPLAAAAPGVSAKYRRNGRRPEDILETLIWRAFKMLGYDVEALGHSKRGRRVPDGIAYARRERYAILFDSKMRTDGYGIGTDDRAIIEYVKSHTRRLELNGIDNIYFCIISSTFKGDNAVPIAKIRKETRAKNVTLLSTGLLLFLIELRLKFPTFDLATLEGLFLRSKSEEIKKDDVKRELRYSTVE